MSSLATAVVGTAVIGAYSANKAADKASSATKAGLKQSGDLARESRENAMTLYSQGRKSAQTGLTSAFDFYKKASPARYQPMMLGNVAAQKAIGQGAIQANNAILGNPVDMSFAQPQQITPDMSYLNAAQIPQYDSPFSMGSGGEQAVDPATGKPSSTEMILTGGGLVMPIQDALKPKNALTNPLGLSDKVRDKDPVSRAIKKIF